jgi:sigma-54 dependent transcriptional regulator, acetoin dehydrogenase operon transcriptional activator AcoR
VFASEHFVEAWQYWSCSAAPIFAPGSAEIVGVVDLTGPWAAHDVQGLVAARAIAHAIEERLRSAQMVRDQVVEYAFRATAAAGDGVFAVDHRGRVLAVNDVARRRLAFQGHDVPVPIREGLETLMQEKAHAAENERALEWPGMPGGVKLLVSPVRYDQRAVGAVVRVLGNSAQRPRALARGGASAASAARTRYGFDDLLGESEPIRHAVALARMASRNDLPVLLCGESGTGKELFAQAIHASSARGPGPFIAVNCGCIPAALLEAELFGYEAGTFTGGRKEGNAGKFEEAGGGTIFLDEASELSAQAQTALLRVLQEREIVRLGGSSPRRVDIRVVAASNKSLPEEIRAGRFRSDLYFRLNVLAIAVPALRDRSSDVDLLAATFLREAEAEVARSGLSFSPEALQALGEYDWPGNVRELRNVVLRCAATAPAAVIGVADLPEEVRASVAAARAPAPPRLTLVPGAKRGEAVEESDREALLRALESSSWNVARAAQALQISRMTLYRRLHKYGIQR